jgi:hypothetical protein
MAFMYSSMCVSDIWCEVAQQIAVASRNVLCTSFCLYLSTSVADELFVRCVLI